MIPRVVATHCEVWLSIHRIAPQWLNEIHAANIAPLERRNVLSVGTLDGEEDRVAEMKWWKRARKRDAGATPVGMTYGEKVSVV